MPNELLTRVNRSFRFRLHRLLRRCLRSTGSDWARVSLFVDYPVDPAPRWGYGQDAHGELEAIIASQTSTYAEHLARIESMSERLGAFPVQSDERSPYHYDNLWFRAVDAAALYSIVAFASPQLYLEVGSGTSTRITRAAIDDLSLPTKIVSIDPDPRSDIDDICDEVIRCPLERADLTVFDRLKPGDICFFDGSHRVFPNSDATVSILEILPRLPPGVWVHFHDIFLPYDYPPEWSDRLYSEQYLLAAYLMGGGRNLQIEFPASWISRHDDLRPRGGIWDELHRLGVNAAGVSFWLRTV